MCVTASWRVVARDGTLSDVKSSLEPTHVAQLERSQSQVPTHKPADRAGIAEPPEFLHATGGPVADGHEPDRIERTECLEHDARRLPTRGGEAARGGAARDATPLSEMVEPATRRRFERRDRYEDA